MALTFFHETVKLDLSLSLNLEIWSDFKPDSHLFQLTWDLDLSRLTWISLNKIQTWIVLILTQLTSIYID